jgi:ABC-type glycerol-3-phosphate transport system permease component
MNYSALNYIPQPSRQAERIQQVGGAINTALQGAAGIAGAVQEQKRVKLNDQQNGELYMGLARGVSAMKPELLSQLGLVDTLFGIGLPYFASAFAIFLLRQTFKTIPKELVEAAMMEGATALQVLRHVYIPLAKPTYLAFALVSVSYHWNNFLWPLVVSNSVESRPLTVGLQVFSSTDQGIDWSIITAATLLTSGPLLLGFLIFQRQFVQSFMRAGIK